MIFADFAKTIIILGKDNSSLIQQNLKELAKSQISSTVERLSIQRLNIKRIFGAVVQRFKYDVEYIYVTVSRPETTFHF
jgi:hypothetical protein